MNALKRAVGFDRFKRMTEGGFLLLAAFILLLFATFYTLIMTGMMPTVIFR